MRRVFNRETNKALRELQAYAIINFNKEFKKEQKMKKNFEIYVNYLKKYNVYSEEMMNEMGEKIMKSSFNMNECNGGCYDGALVDVVLNRLCKTAFYMNETLKQTCPIMAVNTDSLIKVLLLQHIAKSDYYVETTEQWKKNKGIRYSFNESIQTQMKCGSRSLYLCNKYNIHLTEEEFEAMTVIDNSEKDFNSYYTPLATLVKSVNQMTLVELQQLKNGVKK